MARLAEFAVGGEIGNFGLPEVAFTRSRLAFHPREEVWQWRDGPFRVYLDFRRLKLPQTVPLDALKYTLHIFARNNSPAYLGNLFRAFVHFLALREGDRPLETINATEAANYIARLGADISRIGTLNALLQKWAALGLPGVTRDCVQYLKNRRKPGNKKGTAVRQRDPFDGPFSEEEYTSLYKAVDAAYGRGKLPLWVIVLTRLLFACGGRISQYASLKICDFSSKDGSFILQLPQAKTGLPNSRSSFLDFRLSPQTERMLKEHIKRHQDAGASDSSPLFPENEVLGIGARDDRYPANDQFHGHCTSANLSIELRDYLEQIAPPTSRLDFDPMPITPKRFRSTFGTRLAEEGAGRAEIAERLGHVDLQNVNVYFEASPSIVDNMDKAIGKHLAPLARAFKGRLVEDEQHSTNKGTLGSRIIDFRVSSKPLASCAGSTQSCAFNKPVACYTCFKFEPWLDGPHEMVLNRLEAERERWANDQRIAAINDDAIEAVKEVIAACSLVRASHAKRGPA